MQEIQEERKEQDGRTSSQDLSEIKSVAARAVGRRSAVFLSASGGVGLSGLCSLTALQLKNRGRRTALVDADFASGGLDVLLGLENDKGLRFGTLNAPLGKIDGEVLCKRLPHWEGIPVLAFDSWNSEVPEWWEAEAAMAALERSVDIVLVDGSRGRVIDMVPQLRHAPVVLVTELSVLGLARCRALMQRVSSGRISSSGRGGASCADGTDGSCDLSDRLSSRSNGADIAKEEGGIRNFENPAPVRLAAIVGIEPRGTSRRRGVVSVNEASEYLGHRVLGPMCLNSARISDALEGLGLKISKSDRSVMTQLANALSDAVEGDEQR